MELSDFLQQFVTVGVDHAEQFLGCHVQKDGKTVFRVWAPNAERVSVVGDFNFWNCEDLPMQRIGSGVWQAESAFAKVGNAYKFCIRGQNGRTVYKTDPYARRFCRLPDTSGVIEDETEFLWNEGSWKEYNRKKPKPVNIYEVHAGSWKMREDGTAMDYDDLRRELIPYVKKMGYTHIELMPVMEFPYDASWGYQLTGYFAPSHRYGTPLQLKKFIEACHRAKLGVILDWVPAHFPKDENGLYEFDGTCCYELSDPRMREHPDWGTRIFDYAKPEVRSFLISNAVYWIEQFHADGLRVDAVASMLYLDYNRRDFVPNRFGGRENLDAIEFLRRLNTAAFAANPDVLMIAEESTAFPMVTKPGYDGGLGFSHKWNMGWMNDMLRYMSLDPLFRKNNHHALTFSMAYAFSENFVLPLSHDEVVHGKCSLIGKMPGDYDSKFHNLRVFYGYQIAHPGKKLNFMGNEFAQFIEWNYKQGLDWLLLGYDRHRQMQEYVKALNRFYLKTKAFWEQDDGWEGFHWLSPDDCDNSVIVFERIAKDGRPYVVFCNFCPVLRQQYRVGLSKRGCYVPVFSSDDAQFGGEGRTLSYVCSEKVPSHGQAQSGEFVLPPLSFTVYRYQRTKPKEKSV